MKKLPRRFRRLEDEPGYDREIWQPSWKCFCCLDTGIVYQNLARLIIEGYDSSKDKWPRCQNPSCDAGSHFDQDQWEEQLDWRFDGVLCQELDQLYREDWQNVTSTRFQAHKQKVNEGLKTIAAVSSLRRRDRTSEEQYEAARAHSEAIARANWEPELKEVEVVELLNR